MIKKIVIGCFLLLLIPTVGYGFTYTYDRDGPAGSVNANTIDTHIQESKKGITERLDVDHVMPDNNTGLNSLTCGYHRTVTLLNDQTVSAGVANDGILHVEDVSSVAELFYMDEDDNDLQLTSGGKLAYANPTEFSNVSISGNCTIGGNLSVAGILEGDAVVQVALTQTGNLIGCGTAVVEDDSKPQITEGDEILRKTITPKSATNYLRIQATVSYTTDISSNASFVVLAAYQDATADSIGASFNQSSAQTEEADHITLDFFVLAGTESSTAISIRIGSDRQSLTVNGLNGVRYLGGVSFATLIVTEYLASDVDATLTSA